MPSLAPARVLIADSDPDVPLLYANILGLKDHQVIHVTDGRDALVRALGAPPQFVITEIVLPFVDGYSLCEILRRDPDTQSVPILVITADARAESRERAMLAGADSVLLKPCDPDAVRREVERLNGHSRSLRARAEQLVLNATARRARANAALERSVERRRTRKNRTIDRRATSQPPVSPPQLRCPVCDQALIYTTSYIGGVAQSFAEQWDRYACPTGCGEFQYRQRTRRLRAV